VVGGSVSAHNVPFSMLCFSFTNPSRMELRKREKEKKKEKKKKKAQQIG
jgi:hypothetical protein